MSELVREKHPKDCSCLKCDCHYGWGEKKLVEKIQKNLAKKSNKLKKDKQGG